MTLTIYSKSHCAHCDNAKRYLLERGIPFREVSIELDPEAREFIMEQGHRTVPQIYYNGRLFVDGGWMALSKMTATDIQNEIELRDQLASGTL